MHQPRVVSSATQHQPADVLVEPEWLAANIADPNVRVVEVDVSAVAYQNGHVEGAVLWNVYTDLKDSDYRLVGGTALERLLGHAEVTPESTVVFYGYAAALGFWLMKLYRHRDVRILNCSRDTWRSDGHRWTRERAMPSPAAYPLGEQDRSIRAQRGDVEEAIQRSTAAMLDVRSAAEYRGERFWPSGAVEPNGRSGHIAGAIHQPIDGLHDSRGAFLPPAALRTMFPSLDVVGEMPLITYCTIGGRAAMAWFVLTCLLGRDEVRVYDDSWAEWGRLPDSAIEVA